MDTIRPGTQGPPTNWEGRERAAAAAPRVAGSLSRGLGPSPFRTMPRGSGILGICAACRGSISRGGRERSHRGCCPERPWSPTTGLHTSSSTDPQARGQPLPHTHARSPYGTPVPGSCLASQAWVPPPISSPPLGPPMELNLSPRPHFIKHISFLYNNVNASPGLVLDEVPVTV